MKKFFVLIVLFVSIVALVMVKQVNAQAESVETVLHNILTQQKVSNIKQLNFSKVSDSQWEQLGDAVMEAQHPGAAHEAMDRMMGGEGSESLKQMHINMGKAYLGRGDGSMGMMGYGNSMAGGYGIFSGITWLTVIVFLLAGTYFFIKQANKK